MAADVSSPLTEMTFGPLWTITVTLDDVNAVITEMNVYGANTIAELPPDEPPVPVLLGYVPPGAA